MLTQKVGNDILMSRNYKKKLPKKKNKRGVKNEKKH